METVSEDSLLFPKLRAPSTCVLSGSTGSGKTTLIHRILKSKDELFEKKVHKVMYCMSVDQRLFTEMRRTVPGIIFKRGLPSQEDLEDFTDGSLHTLVVLDDLMLETVESKSMLSLFTQWSHHTCISVFFLTQNLYQKGKCARTLNMNTHYLFIMANPRDFTQVNVLAKQTGFAHTLIDSYDDAVRKKTYGYLVVSLHPADIARYSLSESPRLKSRIHTNIFPGEDLISYL